MLYDNGTLGCVLPYYTVPIIHKLPNIDALKTAFCKYMKVFYTLILINNVLSYSGSKALISLTRHLHVNIILLAHLTYTHKSICLQSHTSLTVALDLLEVYIIDHFSISLRYRYRDIECRNIDNFDINQYLFIAKKTT